MEKISVAYHIGYGHTGTRANGIVSGIRGVDDVTAKAFGARVATVVHDLPG